MEGKLSTPDWASNLNYYHHSNVKSAPFHLHVFDKCYKRPLVKKAWEVIKLSEDKEQIQEAWRTVKLLQTKSAPMQAGTTVQKLVDAKLITENEDDYKTAKEEFLASEPVDWDVRDSFKHHYYSDLIEIVAENAISGLKEVSQQLGLNQFLGEKEYLFELPGCALPYSGREDFESGHIELKTVWPTANERSKTGFYKKPLPKEPLDSWLGQVAGYWYASKKSPTIVVANEDDYVIFNSDNCSKLSDEYLDQVMGSAIVTCKRRENILRKAKNVKELFELIEPDFSDWRWNNMNPDQRDLAKKLWGYK